MQELASPFFLPDSIPNAYLFRDYLTHCGNKNVGQGEHEDDRQPHAQAIKGGLGDSQGGA